MFRGDRIFRDMQLRQEQSMETLSRSIGTCLETQRTFHAEHGRLLSAVQDLAVMVMPFAQLNSHAAQAQTRAATIVEETEAFKRQLQNEDNRLSACAAAASMSAPVPTSTSPTAASQISDDTFSITLRKADDVSLGLSVNADEKDDNTLLVENILCGGAVDSWNQQWSGDASGERVVVAGDRIIKVNKIEGDVRKMLEECTTQRMVKLLISRGPAGAQVRAAATCGVSPARQVDEAAPVPLTASDPPISNLRKKAPEFVPSGTDATPLQQTQCLAPPPGIFGPPGLSTQKSANKPCVGPFDGDSLKRDVCAVVESVLSRGYSELLAGDAEEECDKENF